MQGNFSFHNPTRLHFGKESLAKLSEELQNYGPKVMLTYGGGSIKKNPSTGSGQVSIYDQVVAILKAAGKTIIEEPGVMPNPTIEKVLEGAKLAKEEKVDLILAVGGGSTCDYAKAVAGCAYQDKDVWQHYFHEFGALDCQWIPVACVLTMAGTGSGMDAFSVISSHAENRKMFYYFRNPDFSILNPEFTFTVPQYQMVAGIYDIMSHILEQYLSDTDDNTSDYIAEGLMRSLIVSSRKALLNPQDYEARSNIMWTATWALNGLTACGKSTDWMVHMLGQAVAAYTDATHGHTLSAVSGAYYRFLIEHSDDAKHKFERLAKNVWNLNDNENLAIAGLETMEAWMRELGLAMNITDCGAKAEDLENYADACPINDSGYVTLTRQDVIDILKASL